MVISNTMDESVGPPKPLPSRGVSREDFTTWRNSLVSHLESNKTFRMFLPGGLYSEWTPLVEARAGRRIQKLHLDDHQDHRQDNSSAGHQKLLVKRNHQLDEFLQLICDLTGSSARDAINDCSSSFSLIVEFLLDFHNLQRKPTNILEVGEIQYSGNEDYSSFYVKFRSAICDNLRKQGDRVEFLDAKELLQDEILSPTFEEVIVLWCLEKIDRRLPTQVREAFGERVVGSVTLRDLQKEIFQHLPDLINKPDLPPKEDDELPVLDDNLDLDSAQIKEEFELHPDEEEVEDELKDEDHDDTKIQEEVGDAAPSPVREEDNEDLNNESQDFDEAQFYCSICNKHFPTNLKLYYHKRIHKPKKFEPSVCEICNKTYDTKQQLIHHRSKFHKVQQECQVCHAVFMNKIKFFQHMKEHKKRGEVKIEDQIHTCEICKKSFNDKKKLIQHRSSNHRIDQTCEICNTTFSNKVKFYRHMKDHEENGEMDAEALLCMLCWKTHTSREQLDDHMKQAHGDDEKKPNADAYEKSETVKDEEEAEPDNSQAAPEPVAPAEDESEGGEKFSCNTCNKVYPTALKLYYHKRNHKPKKFEISVCEFCNKCFPTKKQMIAHRSKFHKVEQQCEVCSASFMNKIKFWQHMREHKEKGHIKPDFEVHLCEICNKTYGTKKKLNQHISNSHRIDQHCEICSAVFSNKIKFYQHVQEHEESGDSGIEALLCLVCWRTHTSKTKLDDHMLTAHPDSAKTKDLLSASKLARENGPLAVAGEVVEKSAANRLSNTEVKEDGGDGVKTELASANGALLPMPAELQGDQSSYMCDACGKELSSLTALAKHNKWHQEQENPTCVKCAIDFEDRSAYRAHMRTHRGENPKQKNFTCEKCGQTFVSKFSLWKHNKIHEGGKIRCETCGRSFYDEKDMGQHVCKHFACDVCDMKFLRAKNLKLHERMHAGEMIYQCDLCEGLFDTKRKLNEHRRAIHIRGKKYKCDMCPKGFIGKTLLEKHKRSHTGERPFKCTECGASFTQKGNLNTHFLLHTKENPFQCVGCQSGFRTSGELKRHRETRMCGFEQSDLFKNKA